MEPRVYAGHMRGFMRSVEISTYAENRARVWNFAVLMVWMGEGEPK